MLIYRHGTNSTNRKEHNVLSNFNAWQQTVLNSSEDVIDSLLNDLFTEDSDATETGVNDFLWFELAEHMAENGYTYDSATDTKED